MLLAILVLFAAVALSGCTGAGPSQSSTDAANVTADRILTSFNSGNYSSFSTNFSSAMQSGANASWFADTRASMLSQFGKFVSRSPALPQVTSSQGYNVYVYNAQFENGTLTIQVVMNQTNAYTVEGLSFPVSAGKPSQQALDAANVTVDRILAALNNGSYSDFSANFSPTMLSAVNESKFNSTRSGMLSQYGKYVSRSSDPQTSVTLGDNVFVYSCQFEQVKLNLKLMLNASDSKTVDGLLFTP